SPTGYGLGKAGWVSAAFEPGSSPPIDLLCAWIDESYLAVAPAKLAALARATASPGDDAATDQVSHKPARRRSTKASTRRSGASRRAATAGGRPGGAA